MAVATNQNDFEFAPIRASNSEQATNSHTSDAETPTSAVDLELSSVRSAHLINDIIHCFAWNGINVQVKDRKTKRPLSILSDSSGNVHGGEMLAIMGPS